MGYFANGTGGMMYAQCRMFAEEPEDKQLDMFA